MLCAAGTARLMELRLVTVTVAEVPVEVDAQCFWHEGPCAVLQA